MDMPFYMFNSLYHLAMEIESSPEAKKAKEAEVITDTISGRG